MAYQNNNNRLNPQATGKLNINPVTQIVNKQEKHVLNTGYAEGSRALAEGLASIGKGLISYDKLQEQQAQTKAIELMYNEDVEGKSKHDWVEAQKNLKGLERFNPHIKDAYKKLSAQDFTYKAMKELNSISQSHKKTSSEMQEIVRQKKAELLGLMNEANIDVRLSGKHLQNFDEMCESYLIKHAEQNAEWTYNLTLDKHSAELGKQLRISFYNVPKEEQGIVMNTVLSNYLAENPDIPKDDLVNKVIVPMALRTIKGHTSTIEQGEFINAIKSVKIGDSYLTDIAPDIELQLRDTFKDVELQAIRDEEEADRRAERELKKRTDEAEADFFKRIINDPNADLVDLATDIVSEYGIEAKYDNFLTSVVNYKNKINAMDDVSSDEALLKHFDIQLGLRQLNQKELTAARLQGKISRKDYLDYLSRDNQMIEKENKAAEKQSQEGYKASFDEAVKFANNIDTKKKLRDIKTSDGKTAYEEYHSVVANVNTLVKTGEISNEEGIKRLNLYQEHFEETYLKKPETEFKPVNLLKKQWREANLGLLNEKSYDVKSATNAFKKLGLMTTPFVKITSGIKNNRTVTLQDGTTKTSNHQAYDLKASEGTVVKMPSFSSGKILYKGTNNSMGNYILVQMDSTGDYMLLQHLQYVPNWKTGQTIPAGYRLAQTGATGKVEAAHLDISFYKSNGTSRLSVEQFTQRLGNKKGKDKNKNG